LARKRTADYLSIDDLRRLLREKQQAAHQDRIEHFRRTGRVIPVETPSLSSAREIKSDTLPNPGPQESTPAQVIISPRRQKLDRLLFIIEIVAAIGLVFILLNGVNLIRNLNQEVAQAIAQPTLTATPLIRAVVLPSGHTPPTSAGGVQPNEAEIPVHLRPMVQSLANLPVPTSSPEQAIRIQIPAIKVDAPIVQGDAWEQLKKGVGQQIGSPLPGKPGNLVLSAHNDVFGEIFRDLDQLKEGDTITIFTSQHTYLYKIRQTRIVEPSQVDVIAPTQDSSLTLISCYPYMIDNKRIAVKAIFQE
jgi:sortase A